MIDDFFDNYDDAPEIGGGIGSFLKREQKSEKLDTSEHFQAVSPCKTSSTQGSKDEGAGTDAATYSESFDTENAESDGSKGTSGKKSDSNTRQSEDDDAVQSPQVTQGNEKSQTAVDGPDSNSIVSPEQDSKKTDYQNDYDPTLTSQTKENLVSNILGTKFRKGQEQSEQETSGNEAKKQENVETSLFSRKQADKEEKKIQTIREWIERKKRESQERKRKEIMKMKETEKQEDEERERRRRQEEKKKERIEEELKEWRTRKGREEREKILRQQEKAEDVRRARETRHTRSTHAYHAWLAAHPPTTSHQTALAHTGGRVITYFDRSRPPPPTYVNPEPWRRW